MYEAFLRVCEWIDVAPIGRVLAMCFAVSFAVGLLFSAFIRWSERRSRLPLRVPEGWKEQPR